ncbi:hypothetical protein B14911_26260 [Bacillus sp. NRRL B-14911]|nr:hypothetical protein B14911_26260 [Bacillus sp. NRRL B-14911]
MKKYRLSRERKKLAEETYRVPKLLGLISFGITVLINFTAGLFYFLVSRGYTANVLTELISSDPKFQREMSGQDGTAAAREIADGTMDFVEVVLIIFLVFWLLMLFLNLAGILTIKKNPKAAAVIFIVVGVLSLPTLIIPGLLITSGILILTANKKKEPSYPDY